MSQTIFTYLPDELDKIAGVSQDVYQKLAVMSHDINHKMDNMDRKLDRAIKPRKKVVSQFLTQCNGTFFFATVYDDGTKDFCHALDNLKGTFTVSKVYFEDDVTDPLYLIEFKEDRRYLWGLVNKLSGNLLYEEFVKQGVCFNMTIPQSKIKFMLYQFFAPLIINTQSKLFLPSHSGWFLGKFACNETFPPIEFEGLKKLPIKYKSFPAYSLAENTFTIYRETFLNFENPKERFIVMAYPFLSMISSLLTEHGYSLDFSLNFVNLSKTPSFKLCKFFQIFNRENLVLHNLDMTRKNLDTLLSTIKDEVFLIDTTTDEEQSYYQLNTNRQKFLHILSVFNEHKFLASKNREVHAGLVTISTSYCLRNSIYNIIISPKHDVFVNNQFCSSHCLERLLYNFTKFLENHTNSERAVFFSKNRVERSSSGKLLSLIYDLLSAFWEKYGFNFSAELLLPAFDFDSFFDSTEYADDTEEIAIFIDILRKSVTDYPIMEKKRSHIHSTCIFYNEEYVWFPVRVMKEICNTANIATDYRQILLKLRKSSLIITDKNSLSRVVQINNQRHEMYVFRREILTRPGEIEFIHLGKKVSEC